MKKCNSVLLVLFLFLSMTMPINATDQQHQETKSYTLEVPLLPSGNYYTSITDEDCIMTLEVLDPLDKSVSINVNDLKTRAIGTEEFAPGTYTRTVRYSETLKVPSTGVNPVVFKVAWQVKFTIYTDNTYPKITYVSDFTELSNFPSVTHPSIKRAQATSSSAAYAYAYAKNAVQTWDQYVRFLDMYYYLYNDDSGKAVVDMTKYGRS